MTRHLNAFTASFSLHLIVAVSLIWFSAAAVRQAARKAQASTRAISVVQLLELPASPSDAPPAAGRSGSDRIDIPDETGSSEIRMPNFTFDFSKIARQAASLFPFLTDELSLDPIRSIAARVDQAGLVNPYATAPETSGMPPLAMSEQALQSLIDRIWSRRERWNAFQSIADLTKRYDANKGKLPAVLRRYSDQNLLQPYVETHVRDPRLWTMLGIASDHRDFVQFIAAYVTAYPSTRATTELLFMLDEMAQGSRDTLLALLDIDAKKDLWWTRNTNEDAYELVIILQKHYRTKLEQRGLASSQGTQLYYDTMRLSILAGIAASTPAGYRASDARFLIGSIYWRNQRPDEALQWWREMSPDQEDRYAASATAIRAAITGASAHTVDAAAIKGILDSERRRWSQFWWERLRKFGHTFETF